MTPPTFPTTKINELSDVIHEMAASKGWWPENQNLLEKICMIHTELSEAVDEYRNGNAIRIYFEGNDEKPCGLPIELADTIIRILDLARYLELDMEYAIKLKMEYNAKRAYRHGGKLA